MNREITNDTVKNPNDRQEKPEKITSDTVINPDTITDNSEKITSKPVNSRYNIQNLKPYNPKYNNHLTTEEAQKRGRNGGKKSGEVRRARKTMRETLENALMLELTPEKLTELGAETSLMNGETSVLSAIVASALREAINGDTKSLQIIRDTIGEMPINRTESVTEIITNDDVKLMESMKNTLIS